MLHKENWKKIYERNEKKLRIKSQIDRDLLYLQSIQPIKSSTDMSEDLEIKIRQSARARILPLLTRSIPDLGFDALVADDQRPRLKLDPDRRLRV